MTKYKTLVVHTTHAVAILLIHVHLIISVRKRAVDAPPHDYIQFAGKCVNEIEISNLAEVLEYEQNAKRTA